MASLLAVLSRCRPSVRRWTTSRCSLSSASANSPCASSAAFTSWAATCAWCSWWHRSWARSTLNFSSSPGKAWSSRLTSTASSARICCALSVDTSWQRRFNSSNRASLSFRRSSERRSTIVRAHFRLSSLWAACSLRISSVIASCFRTCAPERSAVATSRADRSSCRKEAMESSNLETSALIAASSSGSAFSCPSSRVAKVPTARPFSLMAASRARCSRPRASCKVSSFPPVRSSVWRRSAISASTRVVSWEMRSRSWECCFCAASRSSVTNAFMAGPSSLTES
mmetsp:Transcript_44422/g.61782  ORF Transcript_44422/g.61782 Transcript_44422/m.61782 type:complete len:284 (-) Transcript_44422:914-1765(-)